MKLNTTTVIPDDDLFPHRHAAPIALARIVCAVCEKPAQIPIAAAGKLCGMCRMDLAMTAGHVQSVRETALARLTAAIDQKDTRLDAASAEDRARYERIVLARSDADYAARLARARALPGWTGALALLTAHEAAEQVADGVNRQLEWAAAARREIDAAQAEDHDA